MVTNSSYIDAENHKSIHLKQDTYTSCIINDDPNLEAYLFDLNFIFKWFYIVLGKIDSLQIKIQREIYPIRRMMMNSELHKLIKELRLAFDNFQRYVKNIFYTYSELRRNEKSSKSTIRNMKLLILVCRIKMKNICDDLNERLDRSNDIFSEFKLETDEFCEKMIFDFENYSKNNELHKNDLKDLNC